MVDDTPLQPEPHGTDDRLPEIYDELRALAQRRMARLEPGQTIQATALVHEVYLKLVGEEHVDWASRRDFFVAAARSMRNILVDRARSKGRLRRGGAAFRISMDADELAGEPEPEELLSLDEAVAALEQHDERKHTVVMLRYFAGLAIQEIAETMQLSVATVERDWAYAKAWLRRRMSEAS